MKFESNVGGLDRKIRLVVGVIIMIAGLYWQSWWGVVGLLVFLTGVLRYCGLYQVLGINTCKKD